MAWSVGSHLEICPQSCHCFQTNKGNQHCVYRDSAVGKKFEIELRIYQNVDVTNLGTIDSFPNFI